MKTDVIDYSQISLYNTQRVTDDQSKQLFVARTKLLKLLLNSIISTKKKDPPKHQLIVGQRGMGKTTLLKRLEVEIRTQSEYKGFIPLLFPEEQYNLDNLTTFWLNCIDTLADMLEKEGKYDEASEIDKEVERLSGIDTSQRTNRVSMYFKHLVFNLGRRPVLLIDNINLVFGRLDKDEQHSLRAYLTEEGAPIIIGASSSSLIDEINAYDAPFYDAFQFHFLKKLTSQELIEILNNLAIVTGQDILKSAIRKNSSRLKAINQLTGGNPRTAVILFKQIIEGFSDDITKELEGILDAQTPLYKARFEELPEKMQIIVNAIAMKWDPVSLEQIRSYTQMDNGQISPQLKRLSDFGWIEKPKSSRGKGGLYEISERLFNIWFLMRLSSRRQKKTVSCLSKFMEAFYEKGNDFSELVKQMMLKQFTDEKHAVTALALAKLTEDKEIRWGLHEKTRRFIMEHPELSESFELKDLYDGAEEHAKALINAIEQKDYHAIVYHATPMYESGMPKIAPVLAHANIEIGDYSKAKSIISGIKNKGVKYALLVDLAIGIHDNDMSQASMIESICKDAIQCGVKDSDAYFYYSLFLVENERSEEALTILDNALSLFPEDLRLIVTKGEAYYTLDKFIEAESCFASVIANADHTMWGAYYHLGLIRYGQKNYSEAVKLLKEAREGTSDVILVSTWLIVSLIMEGKADESKDLLLETMNLLDNPEGLATAISQMLIEEYQYDILAELLSEMFKRWPDNSVIQFRLAESYFFQNEFSEAISLLDPYLQNSPEDPEALLLRGMIAWESEDNYESALNYITHSTSISENAGKYYLLGLIEQTMTHYEIAASYFEKALSINPKDLLSLAALSELCEYQLNQLNRALSLATEVYNIKPEGNTYRLVNLYRDGMANLSKADELLKTIPNDSRSGEWDAIHYILIEVEKKNLSNAEELLISFFKEFDTENMERETLCYLYAKCIEFDYGEYLLKVLEGVGIKESASPEYYAVQSILSGNPVVFFDSIAKEIREIGLSIARDIKFYIRKGQRV